MGGRKGNFPAFEERKDTVMGREFELKYQANSDICAQIRKKYKDFVSISMETTYYDTPCRELEKRRWMLRRRLENGRCVCTLKTPLPDGSRGEWEVQEEDLSQAVKVLCNLGAPAELLSITEEGLVSVCAARFIRQAASLTAPGCTLELALDEGEFLAGEKRQSFCEVEVELKTGSELAALGFAQNLAREFHLEAQSQSKVQRAMALAKEEMQ